MTHPPEVSTTAKGRDGGRGNRPAALLWLAGLRWCVVLAFVARAGLSLLDARSVAVTTGRTLPLGTSLQLGAVSAAWPVLWGMLALATAAALAFQIRIGWLLGVAVTVAYLVAGIADVTALAATPAQDPAHLAVIEFVELCVPLLILAGLLAIRGWYLPTARPLAAIHRGLHEGRAHGGLRTDPAAGRMRSGADGLGSERVPAAARHGRPSITGSTLDRWRHRG